MTDAPTWLIPRSGGDVEALRERLTGAPCLAPFSDEALDFCDAFARSLRPRASGNPALAALAFWARRGRLVEMHNDLPHPRHAVVTARGLVFHITPSNVDTMFAYSLFISLLAGNANVIRLSASNGADSAVVLDALADTLARDEHPTVSAGTTILRYGHDDEVTALLSDLCDVRVIWGGDGTIRHVRHIPLPAHATEILFADRESLTAIGAASYAAADEVVRAEIARRLANDLFSFDQMGCASPRRLVWVKETSEGATTANVWDLQQDLIRRLDGEASARGYQIPTAVAMRKMAAAAGAAADGDAAAVDWRSNALVSVQAAWPLQAPSTFPGGGLLWTSCCPRTVDLVEVVTRSTQTLTVFGIPAADLVNLAELTGHRGIDRIVPIGDALSFDNVWDGYNLLAHLTRVTRIRTR